MVGLFPVTRKMFVGLCFTLLAGTSFDGHAQSAPSVQKATQFFVPLGVPMEVHPEAEVANRSTNEKKGTAAFKARIALPGSLGETLNAKVQSLRILPSNDLMGQDFLGATAALPGGPGWPEPQTFVTLRRIGPAPSPSGRLDAGYNLYESAEIVLLIADPRATRAYQRQQGSAGADEESQCRRCEWPSYLPDPKGNDPALGQIREVLAGGPHLRIFLAVDPDAPASVRTATESAIGFFRAQGDNYPLPSASAQVAAWAAPIPSPFQVSLAEPAQNPAIFDSGETGAAVSLVGGDLLLGVTDYFTSGRALPFQFSRSYRSMSLGYGPLGSAGWHSSFFAELRENSITGEVEYHDGSGNVWRFFPPSSHPGPDYEQDPLGGYQVAKGVYLRLHKISGGGWRLLGRHHDSAEFDTDGRLIRISDRHRRGKAPEEQGNTLELRRDGFGQLNAVRDDLGRLYHFQYYSDPRPESAGGDGPRYGLLKSITDFANRRLDYEYDTERRLTEVKMPEVANPVDVYRGAYSFDGERRAKLEYRYGKAPLVDNTQGNTNAILHGDFAQLRLSEIVLPDFLEGAAPVARAIFSYARDSGRLEKIAFPKPDNTNSAAGGVSWSFAAPGFEQSAGPAERVEIVAPWGHRLRYLLQKGRIQKIEQTLPVVQPTTGLVQDETVETSFSYTEDGRLEKVNTADDGRITHCYGDSPNSAGHPCAKPGAPAAPQINRLALANVLRTIPAPTTPEGQGPADYSSLEVSAEYEGDNQLARITDGLSRGIQMPVPQADQQSRWAFEAENIGGNFEHDAFGRVKKAQGGTTNPYEFSIQFKADSAGKAAAGLPERVTQGAGKLWQELFYDPQDNVQRIKTSQRTETSAEHDLWDRPVRTTEGTSFGLLAPLGNGPCNIAASGAITERAFDAAGHLARERRLQDYFDTDGSQQCRWVETLYSYNAREQLVEIAQSHLANPSLPGQVDAAPQPVMRLEYDEFGRLLRHRSLNAIDPSVAIEFRYDPAGRVVGVRRGEGAEQVRGYDRQSRVVKQEDGDGAVWLGRFDVWDRLYLSRSPTGAFTKNLFDRAGHLTETVTTDRDPFGPNADQARLLALTRSHFTSFSEPDKVVEILAGENTDAPQVLVTRRSFDDAGRSIAIWSGPALPGTEEIDPAQQRRESETVYEQGTGRVLELWKGGYYGQPPLLKQKFSYETENASPWPDRMVLFEAVPGQLDLVETASARYRRDTLGRVVEETRSDGSRISTLYDRSSDQVLQVRTGADVATRFAYDGAGRPIRLIRPAHRGETLYSYDLDGRLRQQVVKAKSQEWLTSHEYDLTGRPSRSLFHDGSFEELTYNGDHTIATRRTREGVLLTYGYDAANRPISQVPSLSEGATGQAPLDAGTFASYDPLSRPTQMSRGRAGTTGVDPRLSLSYPVYDLGSRPGSEVVGARSPMSWQYDAYGRAEKVFLPEGPGRDAGAAFEGFHRQFDSLDRMVDVAGIGNLSATTLGASWSWGGGRLYGMDTKGTLGTALRLGYLGGEGPQLPGGGSNADSKWKLGTLTWGAGTSTPTGLPETSWGQFGFGYRGTEGDPRDGAKLGREAMKNQGLDLFAGQGWSWDYDAAARLSAAWPGRGDQLGRRPVEAQGFHYQYGKGDELERLVDEATGSVVDTETGPYGRTLSRGGVTFGYDPAGRRTEDDRYVFEWSWRSELLQVTVKPTWPKGEVSPYAGHQVRFAYDAMGRLHSRSHYGPLPTGTTDESARPFIEKRIFVWESQSLLAEAGYGDEAETQLRWRKTYVPGITGLDDAVQVVVENVAFPAQGDKLYTYLRDELGTVLGIVAEEESQDPDKPTIPVRYTYTPYGEAHAETGPEFRSAHFEVGKLMVGGIEQVPANPTTAAGSLRLSFSIPLDPATVGEGLKLEEWTPSGWQAVAPTELLIGVEEGEGLDLWVSLRSAWKRETKYRAHVGQGLKDRTGRHLATARQFEFSFVAGAVISSSPIDRRYPPDYESYQAAANTLGGRFPGGQTSLFQGLWTDPVTGHSYARARWYDARTASWLSEDPLLDVDSPNLYAFVGWGPHAGVDPLGTCVGVPCARWYEQLESDMHRRVESRGNLAHDRISGQIILSSVGALTLGQGIGMVWDRIANPGHGPRNREEFRQAEWENLQAMAELMAIYQLLTPRPTPTTFTNRSSTGPPGSLGHSLPEKILPPGPPAARPPLLQLDVMTLSTREHYSAQISQMRSQLQSAIRKSGNIAVADIQIEGLPNFLAASSRLQEPTNLQASLGFVGRPAEAQFKTKPVPLKDGVLVDRNIDSEYKLLSRVSELLQGKADPKGTIVLFSEYDVCASCAGVIRQFEEKFPNIKVLLGHNKDIRIAPSQQGTKP